VARSVLGLTATENNVASFVQGGFYIPGWSNAEHILLDTVGRQHVILRAGAGSLQLTIAGAKSVVGPQVLAFSARNLADLSLAVSQLAKLHRVLSRTAVSSSRQPHWSAQSKRLRDAMIALDGRRAEATFREIASVIYGSERVARDWPGAGLKARVQRDFQRGVALCSGGYRTLLR
jgi:hypothetical protein